MWKFPFNHGFKGGVFHTRGMGLFNWAVFKPSLYHSMKYCLVKNGISRSWIIKIPNIWRIVESPIIINQQGFWTLLNWDGTNLVADYNYQERIPLIFSNQAFWIRGWHDRKGRCTANCLKFRIKCNTVEFPGVGFACTLRMLQRRILQKRGVTSSNMLRCNPIITGTFNCS